MLGQFKADLAAMSEIRFAAERSMRKLVESTSPASRSLKTPLKPGAGFALGTVVEWNMQYFNLLVLPQRPGIRWNKCPAEQNSTGIKMYFYVSDEADEKDHWEDEHLSFQEKEGST